jgi:hypothetical protein
MLYATHIWKFKTFKDENGKNVIEDWLQKLPITAQDTIDTRLRYLVVLEQWARPAFDKIKGAEGIHEIRAKDHSANIEYRVFGCFGPERKEFTLLVGAYKKGTVYNPKDYMNTFKRRYKYFLENKESVDEYRW